MSRDYRGESECEFYGITCPEDVEQPGDTDSVLDVPANDCTPVQEFAFVRFIASTPAVIVIVAPSPCTPPTAPDVASGSRDADSVPLLISDASISLFVRVAATAFMTIVSLAAGRTAV